MEAVAIGFLHAWATPQHEHAAAAAVAAALPGITITCSADVLPQIKEFERFSTTAVNAYVGPVVSRYLARLAGRLEEAGYPGPLFVILSHGGVAPVEEAARLAVGTALSGPAGGVAAAVALAAQGMGRTSSPSTWAAPRPTSPWWGRRGGARPRPDRGRRADRAGKPRHRHPRRRRRLHRPSRRRRDVAGRAALGRRGARAGLLRHWRHRADRYRRQSGARLSRCRQFPRRRQRLDLAAAQAAVAGLAPGSASTPEACATGIHALVNARMADGVRLATVRRGVDPREARCWPSAAPPGCTRPRWRANSVSRAPPCRCLPPGSRPGACCIPTCATS